MDKNLKLLGEHFKFLDKNLEVLGENLKFLGKHFKLLEKNLEVFGQEPQGIGQALQAAWRIACRYWARISSSWASTSSFLEKNL